MYNYKSKNQPLLAEPIVISFDKGDNNNYQLGYSLENDDPSIQQALLVTENKIHWKSILDNDVSVLSSSNETTLYNVGNYLLGNEIRILSNEFEQNFTISGDKQTNYTSFKFYENNKEIKFPDIDTHHYVYTFFEANDWKNGEDIVFIEDFKQFRIEHFEEKDSEGKPKKVPIYSVEPVTLTSHVFDSDVAFSNEECYLVIDDTNDTLTFLVSDYKIKFDPQKCNHSSIILMQNNKNTATYYNVINSNILRFIISDYGRIISLAQFNKDNDSFSNSDCYIFSSEKNTKENQTISVRFSSELKDSITNVTANF